MKRVFIIAFATLSLSVVRAELLNFSSITSNDPTGYAQFVGESQLMLDASYLGSSRYSLVFSNEGPADSVISEIYFDYTSDLSLQLIGINKGAGVRFSAGRTNPANLPSGRNITFASELSVSADNPSPRHGVNPSEYLELIIHYEGSNDLLSSLGNSDLRVGLHVISLGEYSESLVNVVPEPATFSMALLGSLFMRMFRIRKSNAGRKQPADFIKGLTEPEFEKLCWTEHTSKRDRRIMPFTSSEAAIWKTVR